MHFEQPAPGFHDLRLRLGRLRLPRLMPMPRMPHADAYYVLRWCLACLMPMPCMPHADAMHASCWCLLCLTPMPRTIRCRCLLRLMPMPCMLRSDVPDVYTYACMMMFAPEWIATLPLCHFATLSILRMCKLPSYKLLYILIYNNSYYNIITRKAVNDVRKAVNLFSKMTVNHIRK